MNKKLSAGYAKVVATPPLGLRIPGSYNHRYADGVINDLYLRATAFSDGEKKAVIFSCDAISLRADFYEAVRQRIAQRCDMDPDGVYINCSHIHTAFRMTMPTGDPEDAALDAFLKETMDKLEDCAAAAFEDLKPAKLMVGTGKVEGIAYSRRYRMKDGSCRTNPGTGNPDAVAMIGKQDDSLQLIRVVREGGKEILMVNFGTHADTLGGISKYCGDWPGFTAEMLEGAFSCQKEAMILLGAEGDSNQVNVFLKRGYGKNFGMSKALFMAYSLVNETLRIYDQAKEIPSDKVAFCRAEVKIGKNPHTPGEEEIAQKVAQIYYEKGTQAPELAEYPMNYVKALRIVQNMRRPFEFFKLKMYGLQIGNVAFIGIPGEPFMQIGMDIKAQNKLDMTVVTACTNGGEGYYPDAAAFEEEGYERNTTPFAPDCAEKLVAGAKNLMDQMEKI